MGVAPPTAALGAEVTVLSRRRAKEQDPLDLGAREPVAMNSDDELAASRGRFDFILDTIFADHELSPLITLLDLDGTLCALGNLLLTGPRLWELGAGRKKLTSSGTRGLRQTIEMLLFCAAHGITADVEVLSSNDVETALDRLAVGDVRYRFVLDMSDLDTPSV